MKKAIAKIEATQFKNMLKLPHGVELVGISFPVDGNRIKLTLTGESLPVPEIAKGSKIRPKEVDYEVRHSWHTARISPLGGSENEEE